MTSSSRKSDSWKVLALIGGRQISGHRKLLGTVFTAGLGCLVLGLLTRLSPLTIAGAMVLAGGGAIVGYRVRPLLAAARKISASAKDDSVGNLRNLLVEQSLLRGGQELRISKGAVYVLSQGVWKEALHLPDFIQTALINDFKNAGKHRNRAAAVSEGDAQPPLSADQMILDVKIQQMIDGSEEAHVILRQQS